MTIKQHGGVFGRNPTFNDVTVEGDLVVDGTLTIGGSVITGLNLQGNWNASTNSPDLTALTPDAGQFWIVSVAGSTNLGGITNWTVGDWALYDGSAWQRVEGGTVDLTNGVTGILPIANGGTGASTASTARTNLGSGTVGDNLFTATTALAAQQAMDTEVGVDVQPYDATILKSADIGVTVEAYDATILKSADIGSTVQGYDADTAKYDDTTANFTGTLQNGGSNVVVDADIGSTVQAYDADTAKLDVAQTWTAKQTFGATDIDGAAVFNESGADVDFRIESDTNANAFFLDGANGNVGIGLTPSYKLHVDGTVYLDNLIFTGYGGNSNATLGIFGSSNDTGVDSGRVYNIEWKMSGNNNGQYWYANYITRSGSRTLGAYCTGTTWTNSSDIANKDNIESTQYGLSTVLASNPVDFRWKNQILDDGLGKKDVGFIAQEMELLVPEVVSGPEGSKGISYGNLVAIAFNAIKEQQAIIESLESRIAALESN